MRVSSYAQPSHIPPIAPSPVQAAPPAPAQFLPFSAEAFQQARTRDVPVLLFISDAPPTLSDAALSMQIAPCPSGCTPACARMWNCSASARAHCFRRKARFPCAP